MRFTRDDRGAAAVEFAILAPLLLFLLGSLADLGFSLRCQGLLAGAVASGAQYALNTGAAVSAVSVKQMVQGSSSLIGVSATITGPALYCVTGTPAKLATATAGQTCSDGGAPGTYLTISATYLYSQLLPLQSSFMNPSLSETASVRLQ
nr:TadE/TadG family type IV pilus assembly protein [uncultured Rhodopila sp.]